MSGGGLIELVDREEALRMDEVLVRIARSETVVRLAMGECFVALAKGWQELGFSSFEGYARERCVRSPQWARETRLLAQRLATLPRIRRRLVRGAIGWSMAELLARHATSEDEEELLEATKGMTVRQVRRAFRERGAPPEPQEEQRMGTLELSLDFDEACALVATRPMVEAVSGSKACGAWLEGLLGEGQDWLTLIAPGADPMPEDVVARQAAWLASIADGERRMDRREARAEGSLPPMPEVSLSPIDALPSAALAIDRVLFRELAPRLGSADVRFGELLAKFFAVRGWRVLGFASEKQYAEERLGMSRSSVHARIALARRVTHLVRIGDALRDAAIGYEAATLIARVATPDTEEAWIERARRRTHKHLAEEVHAVEMIMQMMRLEDAPAPPDEAEVALAQAIERDFVSGAYARRAFAIERDDDEAPVVDPRSSSPFAQMARATQAVQEQLRVVITAARAGGPGISPAEADAACTGLVEPVGALQTRDLEDDLVWAKGASLPDEPSPSRSREGAGGRVPAEHDGRVPSDAPGIVQMSGSPASEPSPSRSREGAGGRDPVEHDDLSAIDRTALVQMSGTSSAYDLVASSTCEPSEVEKIGARARAALAPRWPRARLRIRAPEWVILHYRQLEAAYERSGCGGSFVQFLVFGFWAVWAPVLGQSNVCEPITRRDRYVCTCPVCGRPAGPGHHIVFQSHGGSDDRANLTSPCPWCHLDGVHGGRLRVKGEAPGDLVWVIGRTPIMEVHGRERRLAST